MIIKNCPNNRTVFYIFFKNILTDNKYCSNILISVIITDIEVKNTSTINLKIITIKNMRMEKPLRQRKGEMLL